MPRNINRTINDWINQVCDNSAKKGFSKDETFAINMQKVQIHALAEILKITESRLDTIIDLLKEKK